MKRIGNGQQPVSMPTELENMNAGNGISKRMESSEQAGYSLHLLYSYTMQTPGENTITFSLVSIPTFVFLFSSGGIFFFFFSLHSEPDNIFTCEIIIASSTYLHAHFLTLTVIYIFLFYFIFSYLKKIVANLLRAMQWWDPSAGICKIQKIKRNFYASLRRRQVPDNHSVRVDRYLWMCTTVRRRRRMHVQL